jgi:protein SCO1/2
MNDTRKLLKLMNVAAIAAVSLSLCAQSPPDPQASGGSTNQKVSILGRVGIDQRLNQQIPLDLAFVDEKGTAVRLNQYFTSKPVILSLVYYRCPMLCYQELNGLVAALNGITRFNLGRDFDVVVVSFDPSDSPAVAMETRKTYLQRYHRPVGDETWHFLTGKQEQISALAQAVGFKYVWDPQIKQFAHASAIMLLTPDGRLSQYYYGIEYAPRDLQLGLIEASRGKIGNVVDQVLLYCYHYDPQQGKYAATIFNILRISALATIVLVAGLVSVLWRRHARSTSAEDLASN